MGSVGPTVGATMVLLTVGRGKGAPVLIGATTEPDGAEPVGATTVPFPTGYGAGISVGTVGASLAGPDTAVEEDASGVTVTVEVIIMVISRVIVMVASGVEVGPSPPLG